MWYKRVSWWKSVAESAIKVSSPLSMTQFICAGCFSPSSGLRRKKEWPGIDEEKVGKEEIRKCGETITKTIVKYCLVCRFIVCRLRLCQPLKSKMWLKFVGRSCYHSFWYKTDKDLITNKRYILHWFCYTIINIWGDIIRGHKQGIKAA